MAYPRSYLNHPAAVEGPERPVVVAKGAAWYVHLAFAQVGRVIAAGRPVEESPGTPGRVLANGQSR